MHRSGNRPCTSRQDEYRLRTSRIRQRWIRFIVHRLFEWPPYDSDERQELADKPPFAYRRLRKRCTQHNDQCSNRKRPSGSRVMWEHQCNGPPCSVDQSSSRQYRPSSEIDQRAAAFRTPCFDPGFGSRLTVALPSVPLVHSRTPPFCPIRFIVDPGTIESACSRVSASPSSANALV